MNKLKKAVSRIMPGIVMCLVTLWILRTQMATGRTIIGSDTTFHFNRIYDASMQLKHGNISWFMSLYGFNQTGRVVNALYGPIFSYILGAILLLVKKWYRFQIVTSFLIYILSSWGMYKATRKTGNGRLISTVISIIYISIGWIVRWQTNMNFSAITGVLAPYALCVAIDMIHEDRITRKTAIHLMVLMTVTIECHLVSAVIMMLLLLPAWLYNIFKNHEHVKVNFKNTILAVLTTIVLTLNTTLPLIWLSKTNSMALPRPMIMSQNALVITRRSVRFTGKMCWGNTRSNLSSYMLMLLVVAILLAIGWRKEKPMTFWGAIYGGIILCISSNVLPWDKIQNKWPSLGQNFQFPARLLSIAYVLLLVVVANLITLLCKKAKEKQILSNFDGKSVLSVAIIAVALFNIRLLRNDIYANASIGMTTSAINNQTFKFGKDRSWESFEHVNSLTHTNNPNDFLKETFKPIPDYIATDPQTLETKAKKKAAKKFGPLFTETDVGREENNLIISSLNKTLTKQKTKFHKSVNKNTLIIKWKGTKKAKIPIATYAQSNMIMNGKKLKNPKLTLASSPIVKGKKGTNIFKLSFNVPSYIRISIIASLLSIIVALIIGLFVKIKHYFQAVK